METVSSWIILTVAVLLFILVAHYNGTTKVIKCQSLSCKHNNTGKCKKKAIVLYDNMAIGICLYHTKDMVERIARPFNAGRQVGKSDGKIELIDKLLKEVSKDKDVIKSPQAFEEFMKRHGFAEGK